MTCSQDSGDSKGLLIAYSSADDGHRALAPGTAYWESPNIRLALTTEVPALKDPANWDIAPYAGWNGQVDVNSTYTLMVRVRNTDTVNELARINLQGWVSNYTAGGVGPGSVIFQDPTMPAGMQGPPVSFTGVNLGTLPAANPADPNDYASMLVVVSGQTWTPNTNQITVNGGHVCVAVNVYAEQTTGETSTPGDGQGLLSSFLDPSCDRRYGQRNIQIVVVPAGHIVRMATELFVPVTDRCPLNALVGIRRVELGVEKGGVLQPVPELVNAAGQQGIEVLRPPQGDPLAHVQIGHDGSYGEDEDRDKDRAKVSLKPGQRTNLTVTLNAQKQRPGDAYAFDLITTDTATKQVFGAARAYVLVTG
jgi:hypothetical protein